ncbi:MAG: crossover junction endodeoxyribonuclease RuvC [Holosporaceae bacterium]|jgi:Holliday junction resolvasome RuvABC endonuclease subunit|nr:crossover junction endodeoxyribonuclease RuvC [Holosporaceae bacterium]
MNVLALDFGTRSGYAIYKDGAIISGTQKLQHSKSASGLRFLHFRRWLIEIIETHNIYRVFFERVYAHKGTDAAHVYGGFMYALATVCEEHGIKCVGLSVGTIKKFMTGKGNATKGEMIAAARLLGFDPQTHDEADALAILLLALKTIGLPAICRDDGSFLPLGEGGQLRPGASPALETFARVT